MLAHTISLVCMCFMCTCRACVCSHCARSSLGASATAFFFGASATASIAAPASMPFPFLALVGAATGGACAAKAAITSAATRLQPRLPHHKRSVHCSEMYTHTMQYTLTLSIAITFMLFIYSQRRRWRWIPKNGHRIGYSLGCRTKKHLSIAQKCGGCLPSPLAPSSHLL